MGQDTWTFVTLWLASGAFIGGVVTPILATGRQFNDWLSMILGIGRGAVGTLALLLPRWAFVLVQKANPDPRRLWQRDAIRLGTRCLWAARCRRRSRSGRLPPRSRLISGRRSVRTLTG